MRWFAFAMAEILRDKAYQFAENTAYMEKHLNMWFALYVAMTLFFLLGGILAYVNRHPLYFKSL